MLPQVIQVSCGPENTKAKSLLEVDWAPVTQALKKRSKLTIIDSPEEIGSTVKELSPSAVLVLEGGWERINRGLISETSNLKDYVENGGIVLYAGLFAAIASNSDINEVFGEKGFNVGWSFASYSNQVRVRLDREAGIYTNDSLGLQSAHLPDEIGPFNPLKMAVTNHDHALYSIDPQVNLDGKLKAVGLMAPVGKGFVGLWCDRDNKEVAGNVKVILAMLKVPHEQQQQEDGESE
ncbi:hypothetical protein MY11210_008214 [Beauveria gryllotalpidicola]